MIPRADAITSQVCGIPNRTASAIHRSIVDAFLVTAVPLTIRAARQGWQVAMIAPGLVLLRALALGVGLVWGGLHRLGSILANMAESNRSQEEKQL